MEERCDRLGKINKAKENIKVKAAAETKPTEVINITKRNASSITPLQMPPQPLLRTTREKDCKGQTNDTDSSDEDDDFYPSRAKKSNSVTCPVRPISPEPPIIPAAAGSEMPLSSDSSDISGPRVKNIKKPNKKPKVSK